MKEVNIGGQQVRVKASPLALLFYKQEFDSDLLGDFTKMGTALTDGKKVDPSKIDTVFMLQLTWAMAKAAGDAKTFPSFYEWVGSFEFIDLADASFFGTVTEEAQQGFFRGVKGAVK